MNIERLHNSLYSRKLRAIDVEKILYKKFYRIHDVKLIQRNRSLNIEIFYKTPTNPHQYENEIHKLTEKINEYGASELFFTIVQSHHHYPDFLYIDGDILDISTIIDLHIPFF